MSKKELLYGFLMGIIGCIVGRIISHLVLEAMVRTGELITAGDVIKVKYLLPFALTLLGFQAGRLLAQD